MNLEKNGACALYCRVSVEDSKDLGLSIESQEITCRRKASEEGYSVLEVIKDDNRSGKDMNRPGLKRILQLVTEKQINAVFVFDTSRLSRSVADHIFLTDFFRKNKVALRSISQPLADDSASSVTMDLMFATFNQHHRLQTSEKVKSTMYEKARAGYYPSLAPFGYKNVINNEVTERFARKTVEVDKEVAPFVREAFRLYATGNYNVFDLRDILYEKGLRTKKLNKIAHSNMYELLKNRFYIGELHWGEVHLTKAKHEPLIDKDLFERVQKILSAHNNHACRRRKYTWLLGGFLWCYQHECRYTAEWHTKKNMRIAYYHCSKGGCGKYIEQTKLEGMVADKFKDIEFTDEFVDLVIDKVKNIFYDRRKSYESKRQGLVNQRTAFEARLKTAENKMLSETISDRDFIRIRDEIRKEIAEIDHKLIGLQRSNDVDVDMTREIMLLTKDIHSTYIESSPELKRLLLDFFWDKFEVTDGVIIKSHPSTLFNELITYEKAVLKSQNSKKSNVTNNRRVQKFMCARQESNLRPSP